MENQQTTATAVGDTTPTQKPSATKLYVANISYDANEAELQELFGRCGGVKSAKLITDRDSGRPKGFGFVEMESASAAAAAAETFDGAEFRGRPLKVSPAFEKPRVSSGRSSYNGGGSGSGNGSGSRDYGNGGRSGSGRRDDHNDDEDYRLRRRK